MFTVLNHIAGCIHHLPPCPQKLWMLLEESPTPPDIGDEPVRLDTTVESLNVGHLGAVALCLLCVYKVTPFCAPPL